MADFEFAFASNGTPTSFAIGNSGVTGIDQAGTITPTVIVLGPDLNLLLTAVKTRDEIAAAMLAWLRPRGYAQESAGGPGRAARTDTNETTPTETSVPAAD